MCCQTATSQVLYIVQQSLQLTPLKLNYIQARCSTQLTQSRLFNLKVSFFEQFSSLTLATFEIFRLAKLISDNIVFFLPRNVDMDQVSVFRVSQTCNLYFDIFSVTVMSECSCPPGLATVGSFFMYPDSCNEYCVVVICVCSGQLVLGLSY